MYVRYIFVIFGNYDMGLIDFFEERYKFLVNLFFFKGMY